MVELNFDEVLSEAAKEQDRNRKEALIVKPIKEDLPKLTQGDLVEDAESLETIKQYMNDRFGIDNYQTTQTKNLLLLT